MTPNKWYWLTKGCPEGKLWVTSGCSSQWYAQASWTPERLYCSLKYVHKVGIQAGAYVVILCALIMILPTASGSCKAGCAHRHPGCPTKQYCSLKMCIKYCCPLSD